jgi:hypothetical protein
LSEVIDRLNAALEGRYHIERELGQGGMATVYLADDLKHKRKVAIKVLKPELAAVLGGERFLSEIETTAGLQHPHILPLFDSGEADGFLYYVMPYVEGESLRDRLDRDKQLAALNEDMFQFHAEWWDIPIEDVKTLWELDTTLYGFIVAHSSKHREEYEAERKKVGDDSTDT